MHLCVFIAILCRFHVFTLFADVLKEIKEILKEIKDILKEIKEILKENKEIFKRFFGKTGKQMRF